MGGLITRKKIVEQLKADLIGKDAYRGVTLSYAWLANQFGHFALGFVPVLMVNAILNRNHLPHPARMAAFFVAAFWLIFETYNFLGPLLLNKQSRSRRLFLPASAYIFQPAWKNVFLDTLTDLLFFWIGAFMAGIFLKFSWALMIALCCMLLFVWYPCRWWYATKMRIQYAKLPVQCRLSQWKGNINGADRQVILDYVNTTNTNTGKHLLLFGDPCTGKSALCISIATEMAIKGYACSYYTAAKLYHLFSCTHDEILEMENCELWSWRTADFLVIDDIDPANSMLPNTISPAQLLQIIDADVGVTAKHYNRTQLATQNVIWVLGSPAQWETNTGWKDMLLQIGVAASHIQAVCLAKRNA